MRVSISTNIFGRRAFDADDLDRVASAGFDMLDFCAYYHMDQPGQGFYQSDWRGWVQQLRDAAQARGLSFNQSHNAVFNYFTPCNTQALNTECVWRIIEATAMLGARCTVCHPVAPEGVEPDSDQCRRMNRDFFLRASDVGAHFGVMICVENMKDDRFFDGSRVRRYCTDIDTLIELVDSIDRDNVKICVDTGHAHFMGAKVEEVITRAGARLQALHIHDNDTWSDQHLLPYCGTICWERVIQALADVDYQGDFTFEVQNSFARLDPELLESNLRYAREMGGFFTERIRQRKMESSMRRNAV